jgi:hypothetical protein
LAAIQEFLIGGCAATYSAAGIRNSGGASELRLSFLSGPNSAPGTARFA